mmetsp:Transcript_16744/g.56570  ORF Transcript_16744/g.56570 Transcript_16744/m.56570 type:complete len:311 (-) Transcript_16744:98-1030(-)
MRALRGDDAVQRREGVVCSLQQPGEVPQVFVALVMRVPRKVPVRRVLQVGESGQPAQRLSVPRLVDEEEARVKALDRIPVRPRVAEGVRAGALLQARVRRAVVPQIALWVCARVPSHVAALVALPPAQAVAVGAAELGPEGLVFAKVAEEVWPEGRPRAEVRLVVKESTGVADKPAVCVDPQHFAHRRAEDGDDLRVAIAAQHRVRRVKLHAVYRAGSQRGVAEALGVRAWLLGKRHEHNGQLRPCVSHGPRHRPDAIEEPPRLPSTGVVRGRADAARRHDPSVVLPGPPHREARFVHRCRRCPALRQRK